ncbi:Las1-like-domain-containing protein [Entophlyctis helioformis]|nr:Las1-like-domain-containing protein [Entophlyctis helioformis]
MAAGRLPRFVPWAVPEEWDWVYTALYYPSTDMQAAGVRRVKAWASRGKVPHAIESTAAFVEISLRDTGLFSALTENELRLQYAMAFIRFVNGLVDQAQKGAYASSVAGIAESLGLPSWFVELRHSATHDKLPTLSLFRAGRTQALAWLKANYWIVQKAFVADTTQSVTAALRAYKDASKEAKKTASQKAERDTFKAISDIIEMLSQETYPEILLPIMLQLGFLVPLAKKKRTNASTTELPEKLVELWQRLIESFESAWPGFTQELVLAIIDVLGSDASVAAMPALDPADQDIETAGDEDGAMDGDADGQTQAKDYRTSRSYRATLTAWAVYLMQVGWMAQSSEFDNLKVAQMCLSMPNPSTLEILKLAASRDQQVHNKLKEAIAFLDKKAELDQLHAKELHLFAIKPAGFVSVVPSADKLPHTLSSLEASEQQLVDEMEQRRQRVHQLRAFTMQQQQQQQQQGQSSSESLDVQDADVETQRSSDAWQLLDSASWKPCPIGSLPGGIVPSFDLPAEYDDMTFLVSRGILQFPFGLAAPQAIMGDQEVHGHSTAATTTAAAMDAGAMDVDTGGFGDAVHTRYATVGAGIIGSVDQAGLVLL